MTVKAPRQPKGIFVTNGSLAMKVPVWSCAWSNTNSNHVYAGMADGSISLFDRRTNTPLLTLQHRDLGSKPVHSLRFHGQLMAASTAGALLFNPDNTHQRTIALDGYWCSGLDCLGTDNIITEFRQGTHSIFLHNSHRIYGDNSGRLLTKFTTVKAGGVLAAISDYAVT